MRNTLTVQDIREYKRLFPTKELREFAEIVELIFLRTDAQEKKISDLEKELKKTKHDMQRLHIELSKLNSRK